jgi:hypothetical protein
MNNLSLSKKSFFIGVVNWVTLVLAYILIFIPKPLQIIGIIQAPLVIYSVVSVIPAIVGIILAIRNFSLHKEPITILYRNLAINASYLMVYFGIVWFLSWVYTHN